MRQAAAQEPDCGPGELRVAVAAPKPAQRGAGCCEEDVRQAVRGAADDPRVVDPGRTLRVWPGGDLASGRNHGVRLCHRKRHRSPMPEPRSCHAPSASQHDKGFGAKALPLQAGFLPGGQRWRRIRLRDARDDIATPKKIQVRVAGLGGVQLRQSFAQALQAVDQRPSHYASAAEREASFVCEPRGGSRPEFNCLIASSECFGAFVLDHLEPDRFR